MSFDSVTLQPMDRDIDGCRTGLIFKLLGSMDVILPPLSSIKNVFQNSKWVQMKPIIYVDDMFECYIWSIKHVHKDLVCYICSFQATY